MARALVTTLVAVLAVAGAAAAEGFRERFPYVHDPVPFAKDWERLRVEEKPLDFLNPVEAAGYLLKCRHKKTRSSAQVEAHFRAAADAGAAALDLADLYDLGAPAAAVRLGAVGDLMWLPKGAREFLQGPLVERLAAFDLLHGNLETPCSPDVRPGMFRPTGLAFNTDPAMLDSLATGGLLAPAGLVRAPLFDVLTVVNNHTLDCGEDALLATLEGLAARGMTAVGVARGLDAAQHEGRYAVVEEHGLKVAFMGFAWGLNPGVLEGPEPAWLNLLAARQPDRLPDFGLAERLSRRARAEGAELVVASVHWGYEYEYWPDPLHMQVARELAARGVDVVVGHHPHVLQPLEVLHVNVPAKAGTTSHVVDAVDPAPRTCLVAYSLGNASTVMPTGACRVGGLLALEVRRAELRGSGAARCLVTGAGLSLTYAQPRSKVSLRRWVALHDVTAVLHGEGAAPGLRRDVEEALAEADLDRLGEGWLTLDPGQDVHRPAPWAR